MSKHLNIAAVALCGLMACEEPAPQEAVAEEALAAEAPLAAEAIAEEAPLAEEAEAALLVEALEAHPEVRAESYVVSAALAEDGYQVSELSQFAIHLEGEGEWHLNELFPTSVQVAAINAEDALEFPSRSLGLAEAAEFSEESARFDIPFRAKTDALHHVALDLSFAVCNPTTCVPVRERLVVGIDPEDQPAG